MIRWVWAMSVIALATGFGAGAGAGDRDTVLTFERANVAIPSSPATGRPIFGVWGDAAVQAAVQDLPADAALPAVIFLHGCAGIRGEEEAARLMFMEAGYAAFFPDSYARPGRRSNCDTRSQATSLAPEAHELRYQELHNAIAEVRALPWIDPRRVFIMGFSEGGMAVARYDRADVAGAIITAWHCHGRDAYDGIGLPAEVPLLAILGADDPWYRALQERHCGERFDGRPAAQSLVLPANSHVILNSPNVENVETAKQAIFAFLATASAAAAE